MDSILPEAAVTGVVDAPQTRDRFRARNLSVRGLHVSQEPHPEIARFSGRRAAENGDTPKNS
ncbi:hypothetical protein [Agromyces sp. GXQ0307]|uniref:hypothetical protein n=1 Tax=Agromyces sp. GXQ0307 TaxID=3377835 RepID=UPI00383BAFDE